MLQVQLVSDEKYFLMIEISHSQVSLESHFINDLGLDSLDHVEVIMAVEDEFGFEITEDHVDKLVTPGKIVEYVCEHEGI